MNKEEFKSFLQSNFSLEESGDLLRRGIYGESAEFYYEKSTDYIMSGNTQEAIKALNKGLSFNDLNFNARLYAKRARCQESINVTEAAADFSKAWSLINKLDNSGFNHKLVLDYTKFLHLQKQDVLARNIIENAFQLAKLDDIVNQNEFLFESFYLKARVSFANRELEKSEECLNQAKKYLKLKMEVDEEDFYKNDSIESHELINDFEPLDKELQKAILSKLLNG